MAQKEIPPYRCSACRGPLSKDQEQKVIARSYLHPKSDDVNNFVEEAELLVRYANAVAVVCIDAGDKSEDILRLLHELADELTEEALHRLELVGEAYDIVCEREQEAKKAPQAHEGRA